MKSKVYDIVLYSPIGLKKGSLTLYLEEDKYFADIFLMNHLNHFTAEMIQDGMFLLTGVLWTLTGGVDCTIDAKFENDILSAVADTAKGFMKIDGRLVVSSSEQISLQKNRE